MRTIAIHIPHPIMLVWWAKHLWADLLAAVARLKDWLDRRPYRLVRVSLNKDPNLNPRFATAEVEPGFAVWNIVIGPHTHEDLLLFCGPGPKTLFDKPYRIIHLDDQINEWAVILPLIIPSSSLYDPLFTSATQARKNGWKDRTIPVGWSELALPKKHIKIYVLKG